MLNRVCIIVVMFLAFSVHVIGQDSGVVIHLWANGAPGFENRKDEPEQAKDWWVRNIHNPSVTYFAPPKGTATGAAVLICPGGGHRNLVYKSEGVEAARFFNSIGVAAFVLKYRLFREEKSPYTIDHVKQDAIRAMRLIKANATTYGVDTARLGIMGFSAGGEVVSWIAYDSDKGNPAATDPVERMDAHPSFQILVYPGPLGIPEAVVGPTAPPAFLVAANDDACCAAPIVTLLQKYRDAHASVEIHLYAKGDHAFNMGKRSPLLSIQNWTKRLEEWLRDFGYLKPKA